MLAPGDPLRSAYETFVKQTYNVDGSMKPQRTLTIRDEGPGGGFFNTQRRGIIDITEQLIRDRNMPRDKAEVKAR